MWRPNEDLSHIIVDDGMFDHHMPDAIQKVIEHLYRQQVERLTDDKVAMLADPIKPDTKFHMYSNASLLSDMSKTEVYEDAFKITDVNQNTTQAVVHASLDGGNKITTAF